MLVFHKVGGVEDLETMYPAGSCISAPFDIKFISRELIMTMLKYSTGKELSDINYKFVLNKNERKRICNYYAEALREIFSNYNGNRYTLSFNIGYYTEREIPHVAINNNIKPVVLQKEGLRPNESWKKMRNFYAWYLEPSPYALVMTYNYNTKECIVGAGLCKEQNTKVVGMPRLDISHNFRRCRVKRNVVRKRIIYYIIDPIAGLPSYPDEGGGYIWMGFKSADGKVHRREKFSVLVERVIVEMARDNPDIDFVIKGKGGATHEKYWKQYDLPKNCTISHEQIGNNLLYDADCVVGFNSTILFEAVAAGVHVVVPMFLGNEPVGMNQYIMLPNSKYISIAQSVNDFKTKVINVVCAKEPDKPKDFELQTSLDYWLSNSDGNASERARYELSKLGIMN